MGTNFYWKEEMIKAKMCKGYAELVSEHNIQVHIGKRSAAGIYCYDCGTTFEKHGTHYVHSGHGEQVKQCPSCGKKREKESDGGAGMRELGFNKEPFKIKTGVKTCCSFTWTLMKHKWRIEDLRDEEDPVLYEGGITTPINQRKRIIVNEYGDEYTASEFIQLLEECPIEFQDAEEFS